MSCCCFPPCQLDLLFPKINDHNKRVIAMLTRSKQANKEKEHLRTKTIATHKTSGLGFWTYDQGINFDQNFNLLLSVGFSSYLLFSFSFDFHLHQLKNFNNFALEVIKDWCLQLARNWADSTATCNIERVTTVNLYIKINIGKMFTPKQSLWKINTLLIKKRSKDLN